MASAAACPCETQHYRCVESQWKWVGRCALGAVALLVAGLSYAWADYSLTIVHTNDFHFRVGPIDESDKDCPSEKVAAEDCIGGAARLRTAIDAVRQRTENVVLFDAGDQFPVPASPVEFVPSLAAELMNRMGYDAMVLGNHEFDEGSQVLGDFIDRLDCPVLAANVDLSGHPHLDRATYGSVVIEVGGEALGVIGLTMPQNYKWYGYEPRLTDINAKDAVQAEVDKLTGDGVNKIILLSHFGYGGDMSVAAATTGVDVIVGGHSHTLLSNTDPRSLAPYPKIYNDVAVVQAYAFGAFLGELKVTFDDDGNVIEAVGEPIPMDASVAEDQAILSLVAESLGGSK